MNIELPKKLTKQEINEFNITWDNHLQQNGSHITMGKTTIDGSFKLKNGRTIYVHKDLD